MPPTTDLSRLKRQLRMYMKRNAQLIKELERVRRQNRQFQIALLKDVRRRSKSTPSEDVINRKLPDSLSLGE